MKIILITIFLLSIISLVHAGYSELNWEDTTKDSRNFVKTLGYLGPSVPSECLSSRNPIIEPICLPDIPGGYCYHASCGKVAPTYIGKSYTIEVISP